MQYNEFIGLVQKRAGLDTEDEARRAIEATFSTLAERLRAGEAGDLAAQLPEELQSYLTGQETKKTFGIDEFYEKVSYKESIGYPQVREHARAVMSVVQEAVSPGELRDILAQLPDGYTDLFTFSSDYREL